MSKSIDGLTLALIGAVSVVLFLVGTCAPQSPAQIRRCECGHEYHVDLIDLTYEEVNKPENCPLCKKPASEQSLGEFIKHKKFHRCPDFRMPAPLPDGELPDKKGDS